MTAPIFLWLHIYSLPVSLTNNPKFTEVVKKSGQDDSQMKSSSSVASHATRVLFVFIIMTDPLKSAVSFPCFFSLLHGSLFQFDVRVSLWDRAIWSSEFLKVNVFFCFVFLHCADNDRQILQEVQVFTLFWYFLLFKGFGKLSRKR